MSQQSFDIGKVDPCAGGCGAQVRRFASVPIKGNGLDASPSGPWWCAECLQKRCSEAADKVRDR